MPVATPIESSENGQAQNGLKDSENGSAVPPSQAKNSHKKHKVSGIKSLKWSAVLFFCKLFYMYICRL